MAEAWGGDSTLSVNAQDITTYVKNVDFTLARGVLDVTTKGDDGIIRKGGLVDGSMTVTGMWDDTVTTGSFTVLSALATATPPTTATAFIFKPNGTKTYTGTAVLNSYAESSPVDGMVAFTASFSVSGIPVIS